MKRPLVLIVGAAAALLVAAVGASAHTGFSLKFAGASQAQSGDVASGARLQSPEPSEAPEASPTAEPTETPEASPKAEPAETPEPAEAPEVNDEDGSQTPAAAGSPSSGENGDGGGGDGGGGGGGGGGD